MNTKPDFMRAIQYDWNLSKDEIGKLDNYFLRHWTANELMQNMHIDPESGFVVTIWKQEFTPKFIGIKETVWEKLKYLSTRDELYSEDLANQPLFWCSFRAGTLDGNKFSYVIVQEDRSK